MKVTNLETSQKKKTHWFISYQYTSKDGSFGFGNFGYSTPSQLLNSLDKIREVEKLLLSENPSMEGIVILNIIKLGE
jgi:hypothetical protein